MKILITGGAGFIGGHLVDRCLQDGHQVIVLDNYSTGRLQNLQHQKDHPRLLIVEGDIRQREILVDCMAGVDQVFHLAALADIVPSIVKPDEYFSSNVMGTYQVLQASVMASVKRFVYVASSSCYGIPDSYPTKEDAPIRPQYPYALTKWLGEQTALHWGQVYKIPVVSLRLFNVYGPRSRTSGSYGAVFGTFLAQKLAGKAFTVVGDGKQTRDFTFVTDVVSALIAAANSSYCNEVFNVGSGNTYSVEKLVELLKGKIEYIPKRPGEPDCTFADTGKILQCLNWQPQVSFPEGVKILLENIEYWREAPVWDKEKIHEATRDWFKYLGTT